MRIQLFLLLTALVISSVHLVAADEDERVIQQDETIWMDDENIWFDDFNNDTKIYKMDKNDLALNGPAFELVNGTLIPGLVRGMGVVDTSTIALWHFDEGSGTKVNDSSSNKKHGTMVNMNSADWVNGIDGNALDFDGTNDHVKVPWSSVLNPSRITVEAWIYPHTLPGQFSNSGFIVHKRVGYYMMIGQFTIETPSVKHANAKWLVNRNQWQYLAGTYDGSNVKLHLNGELVATTASSTGMSHYNNPLFMGCLYEGSTYHYPFDGLIDEVKMSNKAISSSQIKANYDSFYAWKNGYRNTDVYVQSEKINIPSNNYWKEINVTKICPGGSSINITVIDGKTGAPISGYTNLTSSNIDISGIDPLLYPSIRLQANFTSDDENYPEMDKWTVSWRENISPSVLNVDTPQIVVRTEGSYMTVEVEDKDQPAGSLIVHVFSSSRDHTKWDGYSIGGAAYDEINKTFNVSFAPGSGYDLGLYSFKVRVTDYLGARGEIILMNSTLVYSEKELNFSLLQKGIDVTRKDYTNLTLIPDLDGPLEDVNLTVNILFQGSEVDWFSDPKLMDGRWEFRINPPMDAPLGYYNISLQARSINFFPFPHIIEDGFTIVNRLPLIGELPDVNLDEDDGIGSLLDLSEFIEDVESPGEDMTVEIVYQSDPDNLTVELVGKELFLTLLKEDWYGVVSVTLSLSDDYDSVSSELNIIIHPVQDISVLEHVPDLEVMEDTYLEYVFNASDADPMDVLSYDLDLGGLKDLIEEFSFDTRSGLMNFTATNDAVGIHECNISSFDGKDTVWQTFSIKVVNVNDPPVWESAGGKSAERSDLTFKLDQDSTLDIQLVGSDIDDVSENLSYLLDSGPGYGIIEGDLLKLTPGPRDVGTSVFVINMTDGEFVIPINITVQVNDLPDTPVAMLMKVDGPVMDDDPIILDGSGSFDHDEADVLEYTWTSNITGNIGREMIINVTLEPGLHNISLTVRDGRSLTSSDHFEILVMKSPDPVITDDDDGDDDVNGTTSSGGSMILVIIGISVVILILVIVGIVALLFFMRSKGSESDEEGETEEAEEVQTPGTITSGTVGEASVQPSLPLEGIQSQQAVIPPPATPQTASPVQVNPAPANSLPAVPPAQTQQSQPAVVQQSSTSQQSPQQNPPINPTQTTVVPQQPPQS